jgi:hypothetical protein
MLESPAWRVLSLSARRVLDRVSIELRHQGGNTMPSLRSTTQIRSKKLGRWSRLKPPPARKATPGTAVSTERELADARVPETVPATPII